MEQVNIVYYMEDFITGKLERDVETGYLIAPGVAVTTCTNTLYFNRVVPSTDNVGFYEDRGVISSINLLDCETVDVTTMPAEALAFALWASGNVEPAVVAV